VKFEIANFQHNHYAGDFKFQKSKELYLTLPSPGISNFLFSIMIMLAMKLKNGKCGIKIIDLESETKGEF
jgi:hypothetical protein